MEPNLILVNEKDLEIGTAKKLEVHKKGLLHRAFSIIILNSKNEMLLQRRALRKYHCGGLWTNACCSHPKVGDIIENVVHQRLIEEMGFDCTLQKKFEFIYKAWFEDDQLFEHEYDHVFVGKHDGIVKPNPEEVDDFKWVSIPELINDIKKNPKNYTPWFKILMKKNQF